MLLEKQVFGKGSGQHTYRPNNVVVFASTQLSLLVDDMSNLGGYLKVNSNNYREHKLANFYGNKQWGVISYSSNLETTFGASITLFFAIS